MLNIRLHSHWFWSTTFDSVTDVVKHFWCLQAQDTGQAKWCIWSRVAWSTSIEIDNALRKGEIVRTRPMRGTLHYMDPAHVRWMLKLCASKTLHGFVKRREYLWISDEHAELALQVFQKEMTGRKIVPRDQIKGLLEAWWVPMEQKRVYHLTCYAGTRGVLCFGPPDEKGNDTFVLLDEWIPKQEKLSEQEQLATLASMYVRSHGPVTVDDLAWWTGLGKTICKKSLWTLSEHTHMIEYMGKEYRYIPTANNQLKKWVHLLWWFDEYFLWYKHRSVITKTPKKYFSTNWIFSQTIMIDGAVVGKWKRKIKTSSIDFSFEIIDPIILDVPMIQEIEAQAERFSSFWWSEVGKIVIL